MSEPKDLDTQLTPPDSAREDTDAILSRRRFLIQSGLTGAGLAATGCDKGDKVDRAAGADPMGKPHKPGICLSVTVQKPDAAVSRPCLSAPDKRPAPRPRPSICLSKSPPRDPTRDLSKNPTRDLSKNPTKDPMKGPGQRNAIVCLSRTSPPRPPRPKRPKSPKSPKSLQRRPRICLSEIK